MTDTPTLSMVCIGIVERMHCHGCMRANLPLSECCVPSFKPNSLAIYCSGRVPCLKCRGTGRGRSRTHIVYGPAEDGSRQGRYPNVSSSRETYYEACLICSSRALKEADND